MGLVLSTLVSCVGVLELVAFYFHLRRQLTPPDHGPREDLDAITNDYKELLAKKYTLILKPETDRNFALSTSPKSVFVRDGDTNENLEIARLKTARFQEYVLDITENLDNLQETEIEKIYLGPGTSNFDPIHGRRESSPFPTYERLAPRGSICELVEHPNPTVNVTEVDEEDSDKEHASNLYWSNSLHLNRSSRSRSSSPSRTSSKKTRAVSIDDHRSKLYVRTKRQCRSVSPEPKSDGLNLRRNSRSLTDLQIVDRDFWRRSPSPFEEFLDDEDEKKFQLVFDEDFKNSLDGVKQKDAKKMEFKRRRELKNMKMLEFKKKESSSSAEGEVATKEAFWVK